MEPTKKTWVPDKAFKRERTPLAPISSVAQERAPTGIIERVIDGKHILILGHGQFLVRSQDPGRRREGIWYGIQLLPDSPDGKAPGCECEGFKFHGYCWHLSLAKEVWKEMQEAAGMVEEEGNYIHEYLSA